MSWLKKLFTDSADAAKATTCRICNVSMTRGEAYLLSAEKVTTTAYFWNRLFDVDKSYSKDRRTERTILLIGKLTKDATPYMLCEVCAGNIEFDRRSARKYAVRGVVLSRPASRVAIATAARNTFKERMEDTSADRELLDYLQGLQGFADALRVMKAHQPRD